MTLHLADIASWQGKIKPTDLWAAGLGGLNIKTSHGLTQRTVHEAAPLFIMAARQAGKALGSFHWLTGDATGQAQAEYAYAQLKHLGLHTPGHAHTVDVEAKKNHVGGVPTAPIYR